MAGGMVTVSFSTININGTEYPNPFYKQTLTPGLSAKLSDGTKISIEAVKGDVVTLAMPNPNPMGGKTLIFDLTIRQVQKVKY